MPSIEDVKFPRYLEEFGERLVNQGYQIVPIAAGGKRPGLSGWQNVQATPDTVRGWVAGGRAADGIGILAAYTPAIDVDVLDKDIALDMYDAIEAILPDAKFVLRVGRAPKFLLAFRTETPFRKITSNEYFDASGTRHRVEVLGEGQQWVAYHTHPDTHQPYIYPDDLTGDGLADMPRADLHLLTPEVAQAVIDAFEAIARGMVAAGKWRASQTAPKPAPKHEKSDFDDFVPPVGKSHSEITSLLNQIPNHDLDYDSWFGVVAALHHELQDAGRDIAYQWSASSAKHTDEKFDLTWGSLGRYTGKQVTLRSLLKGRSIAPPLTLQEKEAVEGFAFHPGREYAEDFIGGPEIVEDVLPAQGTAMLFGPSGKGKTFWALDLAFHVHNGVKWRDKDVARGDVMYIAAEAGRGIKKRIRGVLNANPTWSAPFFADTAPDLSSLEWIAKIQTAAKAAGTPSMLIIDTMSASFAGDDSSQKDVAPMIRNLTMLSHALNCLVLFVHHTTKEGSSWRGSGAFFADVDAVLELEAQGEGRDQTQWITQRKHRDGEAGRKYAFALDVTAPIGKKPNGKDITTMVVRHTDAAAETLTSKKDKAPRKTTAGEFETSAKLAAARAYLAVLHDYIGMTEKDVDEDEVIALIQSDPTISGGFEDNPPSQNIRRTLIALAKHGKIRREGRYIRLC